LKNETDDHKGRADFVVPSLMDLDVMTYIGCGVGLESKRLSTRQKIWMKGWIFLSISSG
jgi:hypothetical protein